MEKVFQVQMLALGQPEEIREVLVKDYEKEDDNLTILEKVYYWGQNDLQPQKHPSVSVGDIIEIAIEKEILFFLICPLGFHQLSKKEYNNFKMIPQKNRSLEAYEGFLHRIIRKGG